MRSGLRGLTLPTEERLFLSTFLEGTGLEIRLGALFFPSDLSHRPAHRLSAEFTPFENSLLIILPLQNPSFFW